MNESGLPTLPCMCSTLRRTSRALTQLYEQALRPAGLRTTQFTLLQALSRTGEISQNRLGKILAMDSTSLTRTLSIMVRQGWVGERRGEDRRERWLSLTDAGQEQLDSALGAWEEVQSRLREQLGEQTWHDLQQITHTVTTVALTQGETL